MVLVFIHIYSYHLHCSTHIMDLLQIRLCLVLVVFFLPLLTSSLDGLRVDLTHVDSTGNYSKIELLQRAARRSHHRMSRLIGRVSKAASSGSNGVQVPVHAGNGEFLMDLAMGTPSSSFSAIVDTGSDLVWTQCKPCVQCFDQPDPVFDPSRSSSFSKVPCTSNLCEDLPTSTCSPDCEYLYSYGDSSTTQGVLATETFSFGSTKPVSFDHIAFGCGDTNQGAGFTQASGLVGLGRGPLSLISQLKLGKFSYCLTSLDESKKSPLLFGSLAVPTGSSEVQSTPLLKNPNQPSFYYISLKGITVGKTLLNIPTSTFELQEDGTGGLIIDSGTSITYLEAAGYKLVKNAFLSQMKLPVGDSSDVGLDLCFLVPANTPATNVDIPELILHFDGADVQLPPENYMILDTSTNQLCLTVMGSNGLSIFGNFQQQNMQIVYDLEKDALFFKQAQCDQM